jgi:hypothetical protein
MKPLQVLYFYDEPLIFTATLLGLKRLVLLTDRQENRVTYVAATPGDALIAAVIANTLPLYDAFQVGPFLSITTDATSMEIEDIDAIDPAMLPTPGITLHP